MANVKTYPVVDFYFAKPVLFDLIAVAIMASFNYFITPLLANIGVPLVGIFDKNTSLNYLSNITSANATLGGFIIAALTILITVKSSLKARGFLDAENAMEYLFSTENYQNIVQVFIKAIAELFIILVILYLTWFLSGNLSEKLLFLIIVYSTYGIFSSVFRVLFTLFSVLRLENLTRI